MILNETTIQHLLHTQTPGIKLSLYQPTHPASSGQTVKEDVIRFKNIIQAVRSDALYDEVAFGDTMRSLEALMDDVDFWKYRTVGLAIFADKDGLETVSLSYDVTEAYYLEEQYQVSPLVLMHSLGTEYYILDINHTRPRLLKGSPLSCRELTVAGMPASFDETFENVEYNTELQHQSGGVGTFHGHDDQAALRDNTQRYYRMIAAAVDAYVAHHSEPLLLVGVENRVGSMRHFLSYPHVLAEYVEGNGKAMNEQALHDVATPVIEQYSAMRRQELIKAYEKSSPARIAIGAEEIGAVAAEQRVATLLVPSYRRTADTIRGGYDASIVVQLPAHQPVYESLVREVLAQGGEVVAIAVDAFDDEMVRAMCRF